MPKTRKQKLSTYDFEFGAVPNGERERLEYLIDEYNITPKEMELILQRVDNIKENLYYIDMDVVVLYEKPEGAKRPRYRISYKNRNTSESFVHVYSPNAAEDHRYMSKLIETQLSNLVPNGLIYQPVYISYDLYFETPKAFNRQDKILAEAGYIRPNFDKPDWDNSGKKYCDMYNMNIFYDDSQVTDGMVHKYYSAKPRVEIHLRFLNALYNKKQAQRLMNRKDFDQNKKVAFLNDKGEVTYL